MIGVLLSAVLLAAAPAEPPPLLIAPAASPPPAEAAAARQQMMKLVAEGIPVMKVKAEAGDGEAAYRLGVAYENGLSVDRDSAEAEVWYRRAAGLGNLSAMNNLGHLLLYGSRDAARREEGLGWIRKAAQSGQANAMYALANEYDVGGMLPLNPAQTFRWRKASAEAGYIGAMLELAVAYETGKTMMKTPVVKPDRGEAIKWYRWVAQLDTGWRRDVALEALADMGVKP